MGLAKVRDKDILVDVAKATNSDDERVVGI